MNIGAIQGGASGGGMHASKPANIFVRSFFDGQVKIYKSEDGTAERTDVLSKSGIVRIYKEVDKEKQLVRFKRIQVLSSDEEPLGDITLLSLYEGQMVHPRYQFQFGISKLGNGQGEIDMFIAQRVLSAEQDADSGIDPRHVSGSTIDDQVIETILKLLQRKTV